ncbi:hypothetical protein [Candidatus Ruminimicrobiellum ovillum]|uniref:hypothetical protein n=1 Tax=Candidatus Ruminimicrobiellum ovillum TaxID=1947927 RepID=UPI00355A42B9
MKNLKKHQILLFFSFIFATFLIFIPILNAGYAFTDDWVMLKSYSGALKELSCKYIYQNFFYINEGLYHPLVTLSYSFEITLFGFVPAIFHFDNILLHVLNIILVFLILFKLSNSFWLSFLTAALFAIHPTRTEVVCWISARKDLLYAFFYLSSLFFYIKAQYDNKKTYLILSILLFFLSCCSKAMAITLPVILMLVDSYLNESIKIKKTYSIYIIIAIFFSLIALKTHYPQEFATEYFFNLFGHFTNFINAHFNILFYLDKFFLPIKLYCMYPYFYDMQTEIPKYILYSPSILYILFYCCILLRKRTKIFAYGFTFFLVSMLPASGIFITGDFAVADRYTYIPYIGLFFICAKCIIYIYWLKIKNIKTIVLFLCLSLFLIFGYLSYRRVIDWQTNEYGAPIGMKYYEFGLKIFK